MFPAGGDHKRERDNTRPVGHRVAEAEILASVTDKKF